MKSIAESLRGARHIELFIILLLVAALGLLMLNQADRPSGGSDAESRLARLLKGMDGVKGAEVMISTDAEGNPVGVAAVVEGSVDMATRLEMQSAIQALMDIDARRIRIICKGGHD